MNTCIAPKKDEIIGEWRKQHNEKFSKFYCSINNVRKITPKRKR
jgi:hypothetical protein